MTISHTALAFVTRCSARMKNLKTTKWPKFKSGKCFVAPAQVGAVDPQKSIAVGNEDVKNPNDTTMACSKEEPFHPPPHHSHHASDHPSRIPSPSHRVPTQPHPPPAIWPTIQLPPSIVVAVVVVSAVWALELTSHSPTRSYTSNLSPQIVTISYRTSQAPHNHHNSFNPPHCTSP